MRQQFDQRRDVTATSAGRADLDRVHAQRPRGHDVGLILGHEEHVVERQPGVCLRHRRREELLRRLVHPDLTGQRYPRAYRLEKRTDA